MWKQNWEIARVAKRAGAPANAAAGVRLLRTLGDVVEKGEPLFEIHAQSATLLDLLGERYFAALSRLESVERRTSCVLMRPSLNDG